ncbi:MAG: outer membrane lipid asymmetry maintenance protein MlaD [Formosimonas sp.]
MQQKKVDVWVGLFVLLGAAALVGLALRVGSGLGMTGSTYQVKANFSNAGALKANAPVKMSGVVIGSVADITLADVGGEYKAQAVLNIKQGIHIPQDSTVSVNTAGLLGAQFVSITQGAQVEKSVADGGLLENTQSAVVLEDLITQFGINKAEQAAQAQEKPQQ